MRHLSFCHLWHWIKLELFAGECHASQFHASCPAPCQMHSYAHRHVHGANSKSTRHNAAISSAIEFPARLQTEATTSAPWRSPEHWHWVGRRRSRRVDSSLQWLFAFWLMTFFLHLLTLCTANLRTANIRTRIPAGTLHLTSSRHLLISNVKTLTHDILKNAYHVN